MDSQDPSPSQALVEAVDGLVWHAMDYAGRKLRRSPACPRAQRWRANRVPPHRLHTTLPAIDREQVDAWNLLDDSAWSRVPEIATRHGLDAACLQSTLDAYVRDLIVSGQEYDVVHVPELLRRAACATSPTQG